jgi:predicted nuclease of predicted toxin-antitoxin system
VKLKLDENLPAALEAFLSRAGHDVDTIEREGLSGAIDPDVVRAATAEDRVLFTFDRGLGNVLEYPPGSHGGIVVFRAKDQRWGTLEPLVGRLLDECHPASLAGAITIVQEGRLRQRRP